MPSLVVYTLLYHVENSTPLTAPGQSRVLMLVFLTTCLIPVLIVLGFYHFKLIKDIQKILSFLKLTFGLVTILLVSLIFISVPGNLAWLDTLLIAEKEDLESTTLQIVDGKESTGLVEGKGLELVVKNCTGCHSAKLITQNKMNLDGWKSTIKWMQQTQNLWDLGDSEEAILQYLATNYAPNKKGRRANLEGIEWYSLD